ncbi:hypothetical protein QQP08_025092 [Theobroma cacao]|nr:hypothetical protein QQP08_025092 [Theobroma cacao]
MSQVTCDHPHIQAIERSKFMVRNCVSFPIIASYFELLNLLIGKSVILSTLLSFAGSGSQFGTRENGLKDLSDL